MKNINKQKIKNITKVLGIFPKKYCSKIYYIAFINRELYKYFMTLRLFVDIREKYR